MTLFARVLAVALTAQVINGPDAGLEPSVQNEVDHALARAAAAPTNGCVRVTGDVFATNGLTLTAIALRLITSQQKDGGWRIGGTNVTREAVAILKAVSGDASEPEQ